MSELYDRHRSALTRLARDLQNVGLYHRSQRIGNEFGWHAAYRIVNELLDFLQVEPTDPVEAERLKRQRTAEYTLRAREMSVVVALPEDLRPAGGHFRWDTIGPIPDGTPIYFNTPSPNPDPAPTPTPE